jgi:hypothetical protein
MGWMIQHNHGGLQIVLQSITLYCDALKFFISSTTRSHLTLVAYCRRIQFNSSSYILIIWYHSASVVPWGHFRPVHGTDHCLGGRTQEYTILGYRDPVYIVYNSLSLLRCMGVVWYVFVLGLCSVVYHIYYQRCSFPPLSAVLAHLFIVYVIYVCNVCMCVCVFTSYSRLEIWLELCYSRTEYTLLCECSMCVLQRQNRTCLHTINHSTMSLALLC